MIDLHVHSTASDGTCTPEELAERGRPFTVMALTDHDNTDGCARFLAACGREKRDPPAGVRLPGIELSVEPGAGYGQFHMLGLGIDPEAPCLAGFLARIRAGREERNVRMVERLTALGLPVTMDEVRRHAGGEIVARPHIARVLVEKGYAKSLNDAFARYVASDARLLAEGFARLRDVGLDGVEAVYQANLPLETPMHLRLARAAGLAVTAGSDFHGANKSAITLGMDVEDEESFLAPLFVALAKRGSHFVK